MFKASICCGEKVLKVTPISKFLSGRLLFWREAQFSGKAQRVMDDSMCFCVLRYRGGDCCCLENVLERKVGQVLRPERCLRAKHDQARGVERSQETCEDRRSHTGAIHNDGLETVLKQCPLERLCQRQAVAEQQNPWLVAVTAVPFLGGDVSASSPQQSRAPLLEAGSVRDKRFAHHAGSHGRVREWINQNEAAGSAACGVRVKKKRLTRLDFHFRDTVHFQAFGGLAFEAIHVDAMKNPANASLDQSGGLFQKKRLSDQKRILVKPNQRGGKVARDRG